MDELIDRARRGEASPAELIRLEEWRRTSGANARLYGHTVRLLDAARTLGTVGPHARPRPTAAEIVRRTSSRQTSVRRTVGRWAPWAVAAVALIVAAVSFRARTRSDDAAAPGWGATEVVTGSTELATVQLGEGSVVRLAPSSRLRVHAGRERVVSLEGRAFFAVQRIPGRPLRVQTAAGEARVLGTRFELATSTGGLRVRVVDGRVAVATRGGEVEVGPGEGTEVRSGAATRPTAVAMADTVAPWVGTFLAFQATPLRDAARDIERVYRTPVTIGDSTLAAETITATFTDRPVEEVVNVVCAVLNARCAVGDKRVTIER